MLAIWVASRYSRLMELKTYYMQLSPVAREAYAKRVGTTVGHMSQLVNGHRRASPDMARRLCEASGRKVPLSRIRPDIWRRGDAG